MQETSLGSFESRLEELGVTHQRVKPAELTDAVVDEAIEPAVATRSLAKDAWLSDTWITVDPTPAQVWEAKTGVTRAAFAIDGYGSIYLQQDSNGSEFISLFVDKHIAILQEKDIFDDMDTTFERLGIRVPETRESGIIATGPSATADMGQLVRGAHGPADVHIIVVREEI